VLLATATDDSDSFGVVTTLAARTAPFTYMPAGDKYLLLLTGGSHRELSGDQRGEPEEAAGPRQGGAGGRPDGAPGGAAGRGMPPGGAQGGPEDGRGGRGSPGGSIGGASGGPPGASGMNRQGSADNPRHAIAVQRISVAFLDAILRRDAIAGEWLERDVEAWLGDLGELRRK